MSVSYETIKHGNVEFECIRSFSSTNIEDDDERKGLVIFLSGAAKRENRIVPIFHRWSWQSSLSNYHTVFISDPTLHVDDKLILGWYTGDESNDVTDTLANLILSWCTSLGFDLHKVFLVGSSGGGFAALQLATLLPGAMAVVENPQTVTTEYLPQEVDEHLRYCFPNETPNKIQNNPRLNLMKMINLFGQVPRFVYSQNLRDSFHVHRHYTPFLEFIKEKSLSTTFHQRFVLYYSKSGHNGVRSNNEFLIDLENYLQWSKLIGSDKNSLLIDCRDKPKIKLEAKMACNALRKGSKYGMFTVNFVSNKFNEIGELETDLRYSPTAGWFRYVDAKTSSFIAYGSCVIPDYVDAVFIRFRGWGEYPLEFNGELSYFFTEI